MGNITKLRKENEELKKKAAGIEEKWKKICNERTLRAQRAEAQMAAAEILIKILLKRLGGTVTIKSQEWKEDYGIVGARVGDEEKEFKLLV